MKQYDFENRNCKTCKWSERWSFFESESRIFYCEKDIQFGDTGYVVEDFACNKWESKDMVLPSIDMN